MRHLGYDDYYITHVLLTCTLKSCFVHEIKTRFAEHLTQSATMIVTDISDNATSELTDPVSAML